MTTWRMHANAVIAQVRAAHPDAAGDELRALLRAAYPFGERRYWPYAVWCQCVREACGLPRRCQIVKPVTELPLFAEEP